MPSATWSAPAPDRPRARGALDLFTPAGPEVTLGGWVFHPDHKLDGATVSIDGVRVGASPLGQRDDLAAIYPHLAHVGRCGFVVQGALPAATGPVRTITVEGTIAGQPVVAYHTHHDERRQPQATPPDHLLKRVTGNRDPAAFAQIGLDAAMDLMRAVAQYRDLTQVHRLLDWGCGPGRISTQIADLFPAIELAGCDLDAEAIAWCNQHLRAGAFRVTGPFPPLPFADQSFDAIVAVSVMTHLDWPVQRLWLAEVRRLLRPGGIFAASVHGPFAAAFFPGARARLLARGFMADAKDKSLNGIAPRGYYRSAFQTPAFTRENWAKELEVIATIEAGLAGFQDLVVARRP